MRVLLFGATGMIGDGVLLECLESPDVSQVVAIGRRPTGRSHPKLSEVLHDDFTDYSAVSRAFEGIDTCFFCLGVSAAGMTEERYRRVTADFTIRAAEALREGSSAATFIYVSGAGTYDTGEGRAMWARVKGQVENRLLSMGFPGAWMFRPAYVQPMKGVTSSTGWYRVLYRITGPLYPLLRRFRRYVTSTVQIGRAMIRVAREGYGSPRVENLAINELAEA